MLYLKLWNVVHIKNAVEFSSYSATYDMTSMVVLKPVFTRMLKKILFDQII